MNERLQELKVLAEKAWFVFFNERDYAHENALLLNQLERFATLVEAEAVARERIAVLKKITGCENQPSEFGTVTVEYMERQIAREREACARMCDDEGRIVPITRNEILNKQCYKLADLIRARAYK